jgi:hypothetical protein
MLQMRFRFFMAGWQRPENHRLATFDLTQEQVQHLDDMARYLGSSRVAYLRQIIVRDMERQGPGRKSAQG